MDSQQFSKIWSIISERNMLLLSTFILLMATSCIDRNPQKTEENESYQDTTPHGNIPKEIKELILVDNGTAEPEPVTRRLVVSLNNEEDMLLSYLERRGDGINETKKEIPVSTQSRDEVREEIEKIAEFAEDKMDVKPGKMPCAGMNNLDVAVVYNTGDTSRFAVSGGARCDPSLYPSVWALDSMATLMFHRGKVNE